MMPATRTPPARHPLALEADQHRERVRAARVRLAGLVSAHMHAEIAAREAVDDLARIEAAGWCTERRYRSAREASARADARLAQITAELDQAREHLASLSAGGAA